MTNLDVHQRLLIYLDPKVTLLRKNIPHSEHKLTADMKRLLIFDQTEENIEKLFFNLLTVQNF